MRRWLCGLVMLLGLNLPAHAFQLAIGSYPGTGIAHNENITPAFPPVFCLVRGENLTSAPRWVVRFSTMVGDQSQLVNGAAAGGVTGYITGFTSTGFSVGTQARVNENLKTFHYLCLGTDASNDLAQGSYSTSASPTDNTSITISPAFQPSLAMVVGMAATSGVWKTASLAGDFTLSFATGAANADRIQSLDASGFTVGLGAQVQTASTVHHYLAIKTGASGFFESTYTSTATNITTWGQQPEVILLHANSTADFAGRFKDQTGANSFVGQVAGASQTDAITAFLSTGFSVGANVAVNPTAGTAVYWFGFRQPTVVGGLDYQIRRKVQ